MNDKCTLSDKELIEKCNDWVRELARTGGRAWTLSVPVSFNRDPDMLFSELSKRFKTLLLEKRNTCRWVKCSDKPVGNSEYMRYANSRLQFNYRDILEEMDNKYLLITGRLISKSDLEWLEEITT